MSEVNEVLIKRFMAECPIPADVQELLVEGEQPVAAYKTIRDSTIFQQKN